MYPRTAEQLDQLLRAQDILENQDPSTGLSRKLRNQPRRCLSHTFKALLKKVGASGGLYRGE